jgi:tight adherence protein C
MTWIILAGALTGAGCFLLVSVLQRPRTHGSSAPAALARMDLELQRRREGVAANRRAVASGADNPLFPAGLAIRRQLDLLGIRLPAGVRSDLFLIDRPIETHLALTAVGVLVGGIGLFLFSSLAVSILPELPISTPLLLTLVGLLVGGLVPTAQASSRAALRRNDFRHVVGSFLDLVALNLSGGRGVPEALNAASSVSDGWAMLRLRDTLQMARLQGATPWAALGHLGEETGVAELRDLSAALELVADDGAKVRESLAARAASLRRRELADAEGRAQARSQSMLVAQVLLAVGFLVFLIYPAITRVLAS